MLLLAYEREQTMTGRSAQGSEAKFRLLQTSTHRRPLQRLKLSGPDAVVLKLAGHNAVVLRAVDYGARSTGLGIQN
jgi:hypothetical protein